MGAPVCAIESLLDVSNRSASNLLIRICDNIPRYYTISTILHSLLHVAADNSRVSDAWCERGLSKQDSSTGLAQRTS